MTTQRAQLALKTLNLIEQAVRDETVARAAGRELSTAEINAVVMHRTNNAVAIYCAHEVSTILDTLDDTARNIRDAI